MISTLLNYRLHSDNMARTLERLSQQSQTARAKDDYDARIGEVRTVDEFLADDKLYRYAMKAYGLEDQINSKGLMRKVLESDLTDTGSFANRLVDKRYQTMAKAFNFATQTPVAQSQSQVDLIAEAYGSRVSRSAPIAAAEVARFEKAAASATKLTDLLSERANVEFMLRAVGVADPTRISTDYVTGVMDGTVTGPLLAPFADLKARYVASVQADGMPGVAAKLRYDYNIQTGNGSSPHAAQANVDTLRAAVAKFAGITKAADLTAIPGMAKVLTASVGMVNAYTEDYVAAMLTSQRNIDALATTNSKGEFLPAQATLKAQFQALHDMFAFDTGYKAGAPFISDENLQKVVDGYMKNYRAADVKADERATDIYQAQIGKVRTVSDLLGVDPDPLTGLTYDPETGQAFTSRVKVDYLLRAFDIDPATVSLSKMRAVLTSDPSDPTSYVAKLRDARFEKLAAAFNFAEDGTLRPGRLVQGIAEQTETARLYAASFGEDQSQAQKDLVSAATKRYLQSLQSSYSLKTFLADREAVGYALRAYGVEDTDLSNDELTRILTSDLSDPASYANTATDKAIARFAAAFNFEADGSLANGESGVQSGRARFATDNLYLLQTLEEQAGETSEGTRLALYALRTAPQITTATQILADKALFEVVRTALGLPAGMTGMDIDQQVKLIEAKLDIADFADPAKLDKFIARFAGLYDLNNTDTSSNPALQLFGSSGSASGIAALF